ncbi:hypothetical protein L6164_007397 [Bauhinia variegata]|uniref:Uncharacterized protein n=1 Tax=Bauhinia variegata TaxID=167791 RepID=A0ACB9PDG4_BAUVA|nr:hypothetical protein L6164_007397 [Bauhinia variegata]
MSVQFETSPDGKSWAATVIKREKSPTSPELWIPAIFEILVQDFSFVQGYPEYNRSSVSEQEELSSSSEALKGYGHKSVGHQYCIVLIQWECKRNRAQKLFQQQEGLKSMVVLGSFFANIWEIMQASWEDDIDHGRISFLTLMWWDVRSTEDNPISAAFEHKKNIALLFIDNSTPKWLPERLKSMSFDQKTELKSSGASATKASGSLLDSWRDLLDNPKEWQDYRDRKLNKLVNPRHPDFKRMDSSVSLWFNKAPKWVLSKLEVWNLMLRLLSPHKQRIVKVISHGGNWWDNRSNKKNRRAPDFKHKETGEVLWLKRIPSWALSKLPPLKA